MHTLKGLRESKGLLQREVASKIGVDRTTYVKYERGDSEPNFETLNKLADMFNVSVDYLLGRNEGKKEEPSLDEELDGVDFALRDGTKRLSKKKKEALLSYLRFLEQEEEKEE